jgi:hypothetical protein
MAKTKLPLGQHPLPPALSLRRLIGPSFIILGLGLGSGEVILWPYLTSNYGLGIIWAIVIGITMQFFINMEVERYALIYGESIFVGFARLMKLLPIWFILTTFFGFGWPGIGLAGANLLAHAFNIPSTNLVAIVVFIFIGLLLSFGRVLYQTVETIQKWLIGIGVPAIIILTIYLATKSDFSTLAQGLIGKGDGFWFLPEGLAIAAFLGALAFSGAGGNLNLAQSFYVRDKGYGMGKYASRITNLLHSKQDSHRLKLTGSTFPLNQSNLKRFHQWWRVVNLEHFLIFWLLGLITMLTLALLAYVTAFGLPDNHQDITFVLNEAVAIGQLTLPAIGILFLILTGIMLSATQMTVLDSTRRILTENILLLKKNSKSAVSRLYYLVLWAQIIFGITIFLIGFNEPKQLIVLSAVINAFTMFIYTGLIMLLNNRHLPQKLRPRPWRNVALALTFIFFGIFCALYLIDKF